MRIGPQSWRDDRGRPPGTVDTGRTSERVTGGAVFRSRSCVDSAAPPRELQPPQWVGSRR